MNTDLIEELAYYIESPYVVVEIDRVDTSFIKRPAPKFIHTMHISKVNVATPQEGRHPYSFHFEDVNREQLIEGSIRQQVDHCLETNPEGSKVHVRMASTLYLIEYLYPKIRTVYPMNAHSNFINLVFPRGEGFEGKSKTFGGLHVYVSAKRAPMVLGMIGMMRGKDHTLTKAEFEFLDDSITDSDIRRALGYLKLLGAVVAVDNFSVGIDSNYNHQTLDFIRKVMRILDVI